MRVYLSMYIRYKSDTTVAEVCLIHKTRIMRWKYKIKRNNKSYNNPRFVHMYIHTCMYTYENFYLILQVSKNSMNMIKLR